MYSTNNTKPLILTEVHSASSTEPPKLTLQRCIAQHKTAHNYRGVQYNQHKNSYTYISDVTLWWQTERWKISIYGLLPFLVPYLWKIKKITYIYRYFTKFTKTNNKPPKSYPIRNNGFLEDVSQVLPTTGVPGISFPNLTSFG